MTTHNSSSELLNIYHNEISSIRQKYKDTPKEALVALDRAEKELEEILCIGIKEMKVHLNFDEKMPSDELISRMQEVDDKARSVNSKDVSLIVAVFLSTIGCDYLSEVFHTTNILTDSKVIFENTRVDIQKQLYAEELQCQTGTSAIKERYKGQDRLIANIINKWLKQNMPNIFQFNQENYLEFYDSSRTLNAKIENEGHMHSRIESWLEVFNKLIKGEKVHKPRNVIKELSKKHLSTAQ
jgi:hypothetical protein